MRKLIILLIAVTILALASPVSAAAQADQVTMVASVNGRDISSADVDHPLTLQPGKPVDVSVEFTNKTDQAVDIHRIVLRGTVLGLAFFTYDSTVDFAVAPATRSVLSYRLDLAELGGQATGLINADLSAVDTAGKPIATVHTVTDVRGSLMSVYGLFGIALIVLTALALLDVALAVRRRTLPNNRWRRGMRLLAPGVGVGLIMVFTASVLRVWLPTTGQWLSAAGITAAAFFALGYLAPTTDIAEDEDLSESLQTDDVDDDAVVDIEQVAGQVQVVSR
jgi:hypothetical protein